MLGSFEADWWACYAAITGRDSRGYEAILETPAEVPPESRHLAEPTSVDRARIAVLGDGPEIRTDPA